MKDEKTVNVLKKWYAFDIAIVFESVAVGALVGIFIVLFRICLSNIDEVRTYLYEAFNQHQWIESLVWIIALSLIGHILYWLMKKAPLATGSGIPQIKGFLLRQIKIEWLRDLIVKFVGGILSLGAGLSLGREGPSVQMGATIGLGFSQVFKRFKTEEKYLVTAGASAGLAAAFNAPLAGVIFALEELHKNFGSKLLVATMAASVTADFVASNFFGLKPIFSFYDVKVIGLNQYGYIIILGIIIGILGKLFNWLLLITKDKMNWLEKNKQFKIQYIGIMCSLIIGIVAPWLLGGGHYLIEQLTTKNYLFYILVIIFLVKFLFTVISYGSNVPGGIFLPILVLGAIVGKGFGDVLAQMGQLESSYVVSYLILGMAGFFTAVVKAPITGSVLITEMTGSFQHLLPLITISLIAYIVTDILNSKPIYESLLEKLLEKYQGNWLNKTSDNKVILEIPITYGAEIEYKKIKEIDCPDHCLFVGIKRGESEIIPNGDSKLYVGDILVAIVDEENVKNCKLKLMKLAGSI